MTSARTSRFAPAAFAALALLAASIGTAQRRSARADESHFAFSGSGGVYVVCGSTVASESHPVADTVGYRVERRSGRGRWSELGASQAVTTVAAFAARVGTERMAAMAKALKVLGDDAVWAFVLAHPDLRSIPVASDRAALRALGVVYLDTTATNGTAYEYRVSTLLRSGKSARTRTSRPVTAGEPWSMPVMRVDAVDETDSSVTITWKAPRPEGIPFGARIFRRMTGAEDFRGVAPFAGFSVRKDSVVFTLVDRGLRRNQEYEYYALPHDFWGNVAPATETASIYTVNFTRLPLPQMLTAEPDTMGVLLRWHSYGKDFVQATRIYRSLHFDSGFVKIGEVPALDSAFLDAGATGMTKYYYRLTNVSYANRESQPSIAVYGFSRSILAPAPPTGLRGTPVPGGVALDWESAGERDIRGYVVCRAVALGDTLLPASPVVTETHWTDTARTLRGTTQYRYAVRALSTSDLSSDFSDEIRVRPQIATSPEPPRHLYAWPRENGVFLNWNDPREYDETVIGYQLYRATPAAGAAVSFAPWVRLMADPERTSYFDSSAAPGTRVVYTVASIDVFGNEGKPSAAAEARIEHPLAPPPSDLRASAVPDGIRLEWAAPDDEAVKTVVIYRQERGKKREKLATASATAHEYVDKTAKSGTVYYYALASLDAAGAEGTRTPEVWAIP